MTFRNPRDVQAESDALRRLGGGRGGGIWQREHLATWAEGLTKNGQDDLAAENGRGDLIMENGFIELKTGVFPNT